VGGSWDINVSGNFTNNATYTSDDAAGGVILNGSEQQLISGTGTFSRLKSAIPQEQEH
jgi:hypothetical protein